MLDPNAANDPRKVLKQPRASGTPIWSPSFSAASANPMASSIRPESRCKRRPPAQSAPAPAGVAEAFGEYRCSG